MPGRQDRESDDFGPELEGTWTPLLNNLSLRKEIIGEAEKTLLVCPYMRKRELCLLPGDMALHLIGTMCLLRPQKEEWKPTNTIA
jgi:hypothetical protein